MSDSAPDKQPPPAAGSVGARIFRAAAVVVFAGILVKMLGVVCKIVAGAWYAKADTDCFFAAFGILTSIYFVGEECIGPAFLPVYMDRRDRDGPAAAWRLASTVISLQFVLLLTAVLALVGWAPEIMSAATRWKLGDGADALKNAEMLGLSARFLRLMAPALFGLSLATVTFMLLNARKKFFWASFGDGSLRAGMAGVVVVLGSKHLLGAWALPAGVLVGSLAKLGTHLPGLWDEIRAHFRPRFNLAGADFRRFALLISPLLLGSVFAKFRDIFNNVYVMSETEGGITYVNFGRTVADTLNMLIPYSLSVGMFPYLCELAEKGDRRALGEMLDRSTRLLLFLFLPAAAVLAVAAAPLTDFLFAFGEMTRENAKLVGLVTACFALAMPFYCVERVMMKGYFSSRRTLAPTLIGIATSVLSMLACWYFVIKLGWKDRSALAVVALAASGARALKVLLLVVVLRLSVPMFALRTTLSFAARALAVTALVTAAAWGAHLGASSTLPGFATVAGLKAKLLLGADMALVGAAALVAFYVAARLLRMEELRTAEAWLRPRLTAALARFWR